MAHPRAPSLAPQGAGFTGEAPLSRSLKWTRHPDTKLHFKSARNTPEIRQPPAPDAPPWLALAYQHHPPSVYPPASSWFSTTQCRSGATRCAAGWGLLQCAWEAGDCRLQQCAVRAEDRAQRRDKVGFDDRRRATRQGWIWATADGQREKWRGKSTQKKKPPVFGKEEKLNG